MLLQNHVPGEELMLVAVTRRLRVETPFTDDMAEILDALDRMRGDPSLWQESPIHYFHGGERYHEFELFDALSDVIDLMADYEVQKAIVLFSDLPTKIEDDEVHFLMTSPLAFDYDRQYEAVSIAAAEARIPIYPIHTSGLGFTSPSERLARLAVETGGRFTQNTNDLSLALVKARRDVGCRYAVGFYDTPEHAGRIRRINLKAKHPGLHVHHPVHYQFGGPENERESWSKIAYTAPTLFRDEAVSGQVVLLRPASSRLWQALVALRFPVSIPALESRVLSFGAKLDDSSRRAAHAFDTEMTVTGADLGVEQGIVAVEPARLAAGEYELSVLVDDPEMNEPISAVDGIEVPALPREGLVVGQPLLLAPARPGITVHWDEALLPLVGGLEADGLEPLESALPICTGPLTAVVHVCRARGESGSARVDAERWIRPLEGGSPTRLLPFHVDLAAGGPEHCQRLVGALAVDSLAPGGYEYGFRFRIEGQATPVERRAVFSIDRTGVPSCAD
jgi:hypothetical protein